MAALQVRRVAVYRSPAYPGKPYVRANPALLAQPPRRWKRRPEVVAALGAAVALQAGGCVDGDAGQSDTRVAPLFWQGEGAAPTGSPALEARARLGGLVLPAPSGHVPEDEGVQFIIDELAQYGVAVRRPTDAVAGGATTNVWTVNDLLSAWLDQLTPLVPDMRNEDLGLVVEYVSDGDAETPGYEGASYGVWDETQAYLVAECVAGDLEHVSDGAVAGAIYSPAPTVEELGLDQGDGETSEEWFERCETALKAETHRRLREQVREFVDWLKGQGVI